MKYLSHVIASEDLSLTIDLFPLPSTRDHGNHVRFAEGSESKATKNYTRCLNIVGFLLCHTYSKSLFESELTKNSPMNKTMPSGYACGILLPTTTTLFLWLSESNNTMPKFCTISSVLHPRLIKLHKMDFKQIYKVLLLFISTQMFQVFSLGKCPMFRLINRMFLNLFTEVEHKF